MGTYVAGVAVALSELGELVSLLSREDLELGEPQERAGVETCVATDDRSLRQHLERLLAHERTVVHCHGLWHRYTHEAVLVARRKGAPAVVSPHGMLAPWAFAYRGWKKRIAWRAFQRRDLLRATALHATAPAEVDLLREAALPLPIILSPPGIFLPPLVPPQESARRTALFLGRIHPIKNLDGLIRAWGRVRPPGWRLVVVGIDSDGFESELRNLAASLGLQGDVEFPGPAFGWEKQEWLNAADLFVLPSFTENFGIALVEAMASARPCIAGKGAPWSVLEERGAGWWVDVEDAPLAEAIEQATSCEPVELTAMGLQARRLVEERYTWSRTASGLADGYRWLFDGGSPPASVHLP